MTRTFCLVISLSITLVLTGCGGSKNNFIVAGQSPTSSPTPNPTPSPTPVPSPTPASAFVYAIISSYNPPHGEFGPNLLLGWGLRAGELVSIGNPAQTLIPDTGSEEFISVSPRNKLLFVVDVDGLFSNRLRSFAMASDGSLSLAGATFELGETFTQMVFDPSGNFMFITSDDGLHEYRVDPQTDQLMEIAGSPFPVGSSQLSRGIVMHPSGRWIYASNFAETWQFDLDSATGALLPAAKVSVGREQVMNIDPSGKFLYVLDVSMNGLAIYDIDSEGGLQLASDNFFPYILSSLSFDKPTGAAYLSGDFDLNAAKLLLAKVDPATGGLNFRPNSPLIIPEDLGLEGGHDIVSVQVGNDRAALVASLWAIYLLPLDPDGNPALPASAHADATDGMSEAISQVVMTH